MSELDKLNFPYPEFQLYHIPMVYLIVHITDWILYTMVGEDLQGLVQV